MTMLLTGWMLYSLWVVLGFMALDFLVGLYHALKTKDFTPSLILSYLQDMLYYVLPLLLLASISVLDSTGWIVLTGYYIGAFGIALKYLLSLKSKL
ncbi:hypothetical protein DFQ01_113134 [Paenibacillus cellulosilyticus]|uniref:Uncharacterized protein n=1 Tax=Paenibacillus cellulosilyticus TaxID=375489 RepID=A0A2V2YRA8_9BACL|nr:hypothetical protein [Paenibacillus cellulosilyticus]PWV99760.1 hypothetical protein DFQ01_113134 [Paenibacillus cellulosilyticus]QKS44816.1 hypothetical protein HUB94_10615 [Paenibacillus cellulosilyticus]